MLSIQQCLAAVRMDDDTRAKKRLCVRDCLLARLLDWPFPRSTIRDTGVNQVPACCIAACLQRSLVVTLSYVYVLSSRIVRAAVVSLRRRFRLHARLRQHETTPRPIERIQRRATKATFCTCILLGAHRKHTTAESRTRSSTPPLLTRALPTGGTKRKAAKRRMSRAQ